MPVLFCFLLLFRSELCPRLAATTTMNVSFLMTIYFFFVFNFLFSFGGFSVCRLHPLEP